MHLPLPDSAVFSAGVPPPPVSAAAGFYRARRKMLARQNPIRRGSFPILISCRF